MADMRALRRPLRGICQTRQRRRPRQEATLTACLTRVLQIPHALQPDLLRSMPRLQLAAALHGQPIGDREARPRLSTTGGAMPQRAHSPRCRRTAASGTPSPEAAPAQPATSLQHWQARGCHPCRPAVPHADGWVPQLTPAWHEPGPAPRASVARAAGTGASVAPVGDTDASAAVIAKSHTCGARASRR